LFTTPRIAKNTLPLYFRQILIMLVSLYTVRMVFVTLWGRRITEFVYR